MDPLDLVGLRPLMARSPGAPGVRVGLIDGPVDLEHPDLAPAALHEVPGARAACARNGSIACLHGTFIAGILFARRGSGAPALCPGCALVARPVFLEAASGPDPAPSATPEALAAAIVDCVEAGARLINLSLALGRPAVSGQGALQEALDLAARRRVLMVAAAGNQGALGSTVVTRHPWVIPVTGCDEAGRLTAQANLGGSIGRRGVAAPAAGVRSLSPGGGTATLDGTSVAAALVSGTAALLWSTFPAATAEQIRGAVLAGARGRRGSVAPPRLDASGAFEVLAPHERPIPLAEPLQ